MIALRLVMPRIKIAAPTGLLGIDKFEGIKVLIPGVNVFMLNIMPCVYSNDYQLYENKPCISEVLKIIHHILNPDRYDRQLCCLWRMM
jgi:biotin synthase